MKIKSIAAICKKNKNIAIFERYSDDGDTLTQYIGDGSAVYPVVGLPQLDIHFPFTKGAILRRAIPQGTRLVSFRRSSTTSLNRNTRTALKTLKQRLTSAERKRKA